MTRICSYCKKVMGYKCGKCGNKLVAFVKMAALGTYGYGFCPMCEVSRRIEIGGEVTHGICNECEGKVKEEK